MKIIINLDEKREVKFEAILREMQKDSKLTESGLAKMCFDQGMDKIEKAVGIYQMCPICSKPVCYCGDPDVPHCSDQRCGWTAK